MSSRSHYVILRGVRWHGLVVARVWPDKPKMFAGIDRLSVSSQVKYVGYDAQLCPVIAKGQRAPNAQLTPIDTMKSLSPGRFKFF
jgi:hypothetical protein